MNRGVKAHERQRGTEGNSVCVWLTENRDLQIYCTVTLCCDIKSATGTLPLTGSMQSQSSTAEHDPNCRESPCSKQLQPLQTAPPLPASEGMDSVHQNSPYSHLKKKKIPVDNKECKACSDHAESTKATRAELQLHSPGNSSKVAAQLYLTRKLRLCKPCILGSRKPWQTLIPAETFEQLHPCWCRSFSRQTRCKS